MAEQLVDPQATMSEAELQGTVLDMLQTYGFKCHHTYDSRIAPRGRKNMRRTNPGFPDIIAVNKYGTGLAIELKSEGEKLTVDQEWWLVFFQSRGFETFAWWPEDLNSGEIERQIQYWSGR